MRAGSKQRQGKQAAQQERESFSRPSLARSEAESKVRVRGRARCFLRHPSRTSTPVAARRQRIARRPSCTTRCGMRWHVSCVCCQKTVCACALSLSSAVVVCWQRNVFVLGGGRLLRSFAVSCSAVKFAFIVLLFSSTLHCSRAITSCCEVRLSQSGHPLLLRAMYTFEDLTVH